MYYWVAEETEDVNVPYGNVKGAFRLAYRTLGGPSIVWFKDGVGVVKEEYTHQGTYIHNEARLVRFIDGRRK